MDRYERQLFVAPLLHFSAPPLASNRDCRRVLSTDHSIIWHAVAPRYSATSLMPPNSLIHDRGARLDCPNVKDHWQESEALTGHVVFGSAA
jgi:hypothetical protein